MRVHIKNFSELTDNSYLRADFKFVYYHDISFVKLKVKWKGSFKLRQIISEMRNGKDFSKEVYADYETNACYVRVNNLKPIGEFVVEDIVFLKDEEIKNFSGLFVDEGDFLITRSGTVGIAFKFIRENLPEYIRDKDFVPAGYIIVVKVHDLFDNEFLKYFLYSSVSRRYFEAFACGKSQQNISQADLGKWLVPLQILKNIPIDEIKEKEQEISKLKTQIKETKLIVDEVFCEFFKLDMKQYLDLEKKHIFGRDLISLSKSTQLKSSLKFHHPKFEFILEKLMEFKTVKLKQLLKELVRRGVQPEYDEDGEIQVVKTANLRNGYIDLSEAEYVNSEFFKRNRKRAGIKYLDILIASTGTGSIGKVDIWENEEEALADGHISIVRVNQDIVNPYYLTYYLRCIFGYSQVEANFSGMSNQIELYPNEIEKFKILLPDKNVQDQIVKEIETELNKQKKITEQIEKLKQEIDNLIEKAILGEEAKNE